MVSFSQWIHLEAKDHDLEFVQTVLYFCTQILNRSDNRKISRRSHPLGSAAGAQPCKCAGSGGTAENGVFHVHPKKVTQVSETAIVCSLILRH